MTANDNAPHQSKPIAERFEIALSELIGMCSEAGMHSSEMIGPLKRELLSVRQRSMPSKTDDAHDTKGGLAPIPEAELRKLLELEPGEPIPKQLD